MGGAAEADGSGYSRGLSQARHHGCEGGNCQAGQKFGVHIFISGAYTEGNGLMDTLILSLGYPLGRPTTHHSCQWIVPRFFEGFASKFEFCKPGNCSFRQCFLADWGDSRTDKPSHSGKKKPGKTTSPAGLIYFKGWLRYQNRHQGSNSQPYRTAARSSIQVRR